MRGLLSRAAATGAVATALGACTLLSGVGELRVDPEAPDAAEASASPGPSPLGDSAAPSEREGGGLGEVDAAVVDGCSAAACELLPDGFQLAALGSPSSPCPTGFGEPFDGIEAPAVEPNACSCRCSVGQNPSCAVGAGSITLTYGPAGGGTCTTAGTAIPTACSVDGFMGPFFPLDRNYLAPRATLTGGSCSSAPVKDDTKLTSTPVRVCQATTLAECEGKTCLPAVSPFATCIAANGTLACPAGWPDRHVVGASASFTCGGGCSCTMEGTCPASGTLRYFASADCSGTAGHSLPVTGACATTGSTTTAFGSRRYDPSPPTGVGCKSGGAPVPSAPTLTQATTVCCR